MNNFFVLTAEFWITILLVVGVLKYWRNKFQKEQLIKSANKSYSLFLFSQLSSISLIVYLGIDTQNYSYLKDLSIMGEHAGDYWGYFSIELFTFVLTYIVVSLFSFFIYKTSIPSENDLKDEIYDDNWPPILIFFGVQLALTVIIASFVLRPFLFEWASGLRTVLPIFN
jgi:uncharacterized membrane protein YjfL (UPF0719 family)